MRLIKNIYSVFKSLFVNQNPFIISFLLFLIYFSPYLIKGYNVHIETHDNLDQLNVAGIYDGSFKGSFSIFGKSDDFTLPGVNQKFKTQLISFDKLLFYTFGYFWGYVINELIYRLIAFFGIINLICVIKGKYSFPKIFQILLGFSFASLPFFPSGNLTIAGLPMLAFSFYNLDKTKQVAFSFIYIIFFGFYSHFFLGGFFILFIILFRSMYFFYFSKLNLLAICGSFSLLLSYFISHHSIFLNNLFYETISHRSEFNEVDIATTVNALNAFGEILFKNGYHAPSNHVFIILPSILVIIFDGFKFLRFKKALTTCITYLLLSSTVYALYHYYPFRITFDFLNNGFNWSRFFWINPAIWYLAWGILLIQLYNGLRINKRFIFSLVIVSILFHNDFFKDYSLIIIAFPPLIYFIINTFNTKYLRTNHSAIIILLITQILINMYSYTYIAYTRTPSFKQFFSEEQFQNIIETLKIKKEKDRIGCIGFFPSVANYNGLKTIGSYQSQYPLSFKNKFYKIIEKELHKNEDLFNYFTKWGNRAYLFDDELGIPIYYANQKFINQYFPEINCDLNIEALKEYGVTYLFSASKIQNSKKKNLIPVFKSIDPKFFYKLYIYKIP